MSEWWTYRVSDLLMFSRETYVRLFERYHAEVWPLQVVGIAAGTVILILAWRRRGGLAIAAILAAAWMWVAWAFHLRHYATINWAGPWFAGAFVLQAVLLLAIRLQPAPRRSGVALFTFALVVMPALPRHEVFAIAPDPTALATLGVLLMAERTRVSLMIIPLLWCAISGATLWSMRMPDALVLPVAAGLGVAMAVWRRGSAGTS